MRCKYKSDTCMLLEAFNIHAIAASTCGKYCGDDIQDKMGMLRRFGVVVPDPPDGVDLLEWINQCVKNGTIKISVQAQQNQEAKKQRQAEIDKATEQIIKHVTHNQDIPASPTKIQLVKTLGRHAIIVLKHLIKTKRVWVSQEVHDARLKVCKTNKCKKCETRDDGSMWCAGGCGCKLSGDLGKTWFEALNCSDSDWKKIDKLNNGIGND